MHHLIKRWDRLWVIPRFQVCHSFFEIFLTWACRFHFEKAPILNSNAVDRLLSNRSSVLNIMMKSEEQSDVRIESVLTNFKNSDLWNQQTVGVVAVFLECMQSFQSFKRCSRRLKVVDCNHMSLQIIISRSVTVGAAYRAKDAVIEWHKMKFRPSSQPISSELPWLRRT